MKVYRFDNLMVKSIKYCLITFFILANAHFSLGQPNNIQFHHYTTSNGLSDNSVESIIQDSKGFLWIGTHDGLNRFDGNEFEVFKLNPRDNNSIPGNFVSNIFEDKEKNIWTGSYGVAKYDYKTGVFKRYFNTETDVTTICNNVTRSFFEDNDGVLYIASPEGISVYNSEKDIFKRIKTSKEKNSLSSNNVFCFAQQETGKIWIGTDGGGLNLYDKKTNTFSTIDYNIIPSKGIKTLTFLANGILWIGTWDKGIIVFDVKSKRVIKTYKHVANMSNSLASDEITSIYKDSKNNIWIGHINGGISLYLPLSDNFKNFAPEEYNPYTIQSLSVTVIYEDIFNNVWFGTHGGGLSHFNYNTHTFRHYQQIPLKKNWLNSNTIASFSEDENKHIWLGTDGDGIYRFSPSDETFGHFSKTTGLPSNNILGLLHAGNNKLWATGWHAGLFMLNTNTGALLNINSKLLLSNNSKSLSKDTYGNIWLASHAASGLNIFDPKKNNIYNSLNPDIYDTSLLKVAFSSQIFHDSKKRIWVCSYAGLYMFDKKFHSFNHNQSDSTTISSDYVYTIFEDNNRNIWVASMNGLDLIKERNNKFEFIHYNEYLGLSTSIKAINEDRRNNLWLSSNNALIQFNPQTKKAIRYKVGGNFIERSTFRNSTGEIFFGSDNGFYVFHPDSIQSNSQLPRIYITDVFLFDKHQRLQSNDLGLEKSIIETNSINLSHKQTNITLKYVALSFNGNSPNQYKYKLENFDKDWIDAGTEQKAVYKNLSPGKYTFRVKACNSAGLWNEEGASLEIIVSPPFWKTWWFSILLILALATAIYSVFRYRLASIKRHNSRLKEMVKLRTDELLLEKEKQRTQEELNKELLLKQKELEAEHLKAEKELIQLRNIHLEKEVESKTTDVTRKNAELSAYILQIAQKNELLDSFKEKLLELINKDDSNLKSRVNALIKLIESNENTKHEWEQFDVIFNEIHQNFLTRLKEKYPDLTSKDLRFCAYLRMNLNSKDIADLLNITAKGIEKSRWRLRQKFGLTSSDDLNDFIMRF